MPLGLVARLCLLVALVLLPTVGLEIIQGVQLRREGERQLHLEAQRLAQFAAGEIERIIGAGRLFLVAFARLPSVRRQDGDLCTAFVTELDEAEPAHRGVLALDRTGRPFCSSVKLPPNLTAVGLAYFYEAMATGRFVVSEGIISQVGGDRRLPLSLPFRNSTGEIAGVVAIGIDLAWLGQYFAEKSLPQGGSISILDRTGTILVRRPNSELVGSKLSEPFRWMLEAPAPATTEGVGPDGVERIGGFVPPAAGSGLLISVGLSKPAATAYVDAILRRNLLLIMAALVAGLALAAAAGQYFIRQPVSALMAMARAWGAGNLTARAPVTDRRSELGQLALTFNAMAAVVQDRERRLAAAETRFRTLANTAPDIISTAAPNGTITYANDRWFAYCGLTPEENATRWLELVLHPDDRERCVAVWSAALAAGTDYEIEVRNRRHDGAYRWFLTRAVAVRNAQGEVEAWFGATVDIDDRKRLEEARVAALHERDMLFKEMNHRVKNNLQIVASLLHVQAAHDRSPEVGAALVEAAQRVGAIAQVHELLYRRPDLLRLGMGAYLRELCERLEMATLGGRQQRVRLITEIAEVELNTDRAVIVGLVVNELVTNSLKHAFPDDAAGWIKVRLEESSPHLCRLEVSDDGAGMAPDLRAGLGMTLVEAFARQLGGSLVATFTQGTSFRIEFPNDRAGRSAPPPKPQCDAAPASDAVALG